MPEVLLTIIIVFLFLDLFWMMVIWLKYRNNVLQEKVVENIESKKAHRKFAIASLLAGGTIWLLGATVSSGEFLSNWKTYGIAVPLSLLGCMGIFFIMGTLVFSTGINRFKRKFKEIDEETSTTNHYPNH